MLNCLTGGHASRLCRVKKQVAHLKAGAGRRSELPTPCACSQDCASTTPLQQGAGCDRGGGQDHGKHKRVAIDRAATLSECLRLLLVADRLGTVVEITQTACSQTYSRLGARLQDAKQPTVDRNEDGSGAPTNTQVRERQPHSECQRNRQTNAPAHRSHATLFGSDIDQTNLGVIHRRLVHRKLVDMEGTSGTPGLRDTSAASPIRSCHYCPVLFPAPSAPAEA